MRYSMMQLQRDADGGHTCHVTIRSGDTRRPPVMRRYLETGDETIRDAAWDAAWDAQNAQLERMALEAMQIQEDSDE